MGFVVLDRVVDLLVFGLGLARLLVWGAGFVVVFEGLLFLTVGGGVLVFSDTMDFFLVVSTFFCLINYSV